MHVLGSRMYGFTQELFPSPPVAAPDPAMVAAMAARFPYVVEIAMAGRDHDAGSVVGPGCDDQFEFEFALDLLLDGFERLHHENWVRRR
jgi:hypothetical protein